jgi:hypothetical protein
MTANLTRIAFWTIAVMCGGAQTWYTRHRILTDGLSYLEIAQQYAGGDWHAALNAYWSPLYSWVLAVYLWALRPAAYWEVSALHVVNFLAFLGTCFVFEKFLRELIRARPQGLAGFSPQTLMLVGYVAVLHGGLLMVGIGFGSPDMIAYLLGATAAWLTLRIARGGRQGIYFAGLGVVLGLGYLDRTAFAPLSAVYVLAAAALLVRGRGKAVKMALLCGACFVVVAAPFVIALSMKRGAFTLGESGRLNYGWEVAGATRSVHWQGEPGDLGRPLHPTRMILKTPVPVYEFGQPVAGTYAPWYDPSYWYQGIQPHVKLREQMRVLGLNVRTALIYLATTPGFLIWLFAVAASLGSGLGWRKWPRAYWALILPALAGVGMYCVVFIDKRYIAGFFGVLWIALLAGAERPEGWLGRHAELAARAASVLFVAAILVWLKPAFLMGARDLAARNEGELNVSWMMAERFRELGVKAGDRVAFVGSGMSADWVRLVGAKVVAEVPVRWDRPARLMNTVEPNEENVARFFQLDDGCRAQVYQAFQSAGAVIAVTNRIPGGGTAGDWTRLLDPEDPRYPRAGGQVLEQSPGYFRWLKR